MTRPHLYIWLALTTVGTLAGCGDDGGTTPADSGTTETDAAVDDAGAGEDAATPLDAGASTCGECVNGACVGDVCDCEPG